MSPTPTLAPTSSTILLFGTPYKADLRRIRERVVAILASDSKETTIADVCEKRLPAISRFTFYRLLKGERPSLQTLKAICAGLELPFDEIVCPAQVAA